MRGSQRFVTLDRFRRGRPWPMPWIRPVKRTLYVQADAVKEEQVVRAFRRGCEEVRAGVDVLVNNAGISRHKPIEEMTLELFEEVMRLNVTGPLPLLARPSFPS